MPPEQAAGEPVDERATCSGSARCLEILTGKPPYVGNSEQVLWQAASGDLAEAYDRLDHCGADAAFIGRLGEIVLAADRAARPRMPVRRRHLSQVICPASKNVCENPNWNEPPPKPRRPRNAIAGGCNLPWPARSCSLCSARQASAFGCSGSRGSSR